MAENHFGVITSCYTVYLSDESLVEKLRLSVTLKEEANGCLHPLAIAAAARALANRSEDDFRRSPDAFGPYLNRIDFEE